MYSTTHPLHPGVVLRSRLKKLGIDARECSAHLGVSFKLITSVIKCKADITADLSIRLGMAFDVPPEYWLFMQTQYDLYQMQNDPDMRYIKQIQQFRQ